MNTYQQFLSTFLLLSTFNFSVAEQNFDIKNDLFYEHINAPAREVHQQQLDPNGEIMIDTKILYDENGFINQSVTKIDDVIIEMVYDAYKGHQRKISISSQHVTNTIDTVWSSPNTNQSSDGDMSTEYQVNEEGYIIYKKIYFKNEPELTEIEHYQYVKSNNAKNTLMNDAKKEEKLIFITTLERDQHGSWTKQKEELQDGTFIMHTRTIKYIDN